MQFIYFISARRKDVMFPGEKSFQEVPSDKDQWYLLARITPFFLFSLVFLPVVHFHAFFLLLLQKKVQPFSCIQRCLAVALLFPEISALAGVILHRPFRGHGRPDPTQRQRRSLHLSLVLILQPCGRGGDCPPTLLQCHTLNWVIELSRGRLQINTGLQ